MPFCKICGTTNGPHDLDASPWCWECRHPLAWSTDDKQYRPNRIPLEQTHCRWPVRGLHDRVCHLWPERRQALVAFGRRRFYEFTDDGLLLAVGWMMCAVSACVVSIVDHYDKRNNQWICGWVLMLLHVATVILYIGAGFSGQVSLEPILPRPCT
jgi:hypothetical protein